MRTYIEEEHKLGGLGASESGKLFTSKGLKSITVKKLAISKAEEIEIGVRFRGLGNRFTRHGIENEQFAFDTFVKPLFPFSEYQSDASILITESSWATPDVIDDVEGITTDIKVPTSIINYYNQTEVKLVNTYEIQVQKQLMATGHNSGQLFYCLIKPNFGDLEDYRDYELGHYDKYRIISFDKDIELHKEILKRESDFFDMRNMVTEFIERGYEVYNDQEFLDVLKAGHGKVKKLKDSNTIVFDDKKLFCYDSELYIY